MDNLTFTFYNASGSFHSGPFGIEDARRAYLRLPVGGAADIRVVPSRNLTGEDFGDFTRSCALSTLGFFHLDLPVHREKAVCQRMISDLLDEAYELWGRDRAREYRRIAAEMEATLTSGIWARSTGEYAYRCAQLDDQMLAKCDGLRQTLREVQARLPWVVDTARAAA